MPLPSEWHAQLWMDRWPTWTKRRSSGWACPCIYLCSRAVLCSPMISSDWARGVVAFGASEASPRSPSYKLGGFASGFAHPTPFESTNSSPLVFRIFFCLQVALAPNHG
ncbi:hypothetical protein D1007_32339 [Hordeum vulgare]|nr:hypothetical protein D1007_32339 [Hordeum vulgare]